MSAARLLEAARAAGAMIATAESCTGGMIAARITDMAGSSAIFDRGFVTYSNGAKRDMLGVREATLETHGAVSEPVAREMAAGALARSEATMAVAVTGVAGPGASEAKPEGRVCFALAERGADPEPQVASWTRDFGPLGRAGVREATVAEALDALQAALLQAE